MEQNHCIQYLVPVGSRDTFWNCMASAFLGMPRLALNSQVIKPEPAFCSCDGHFLELPLLQESSITADNDDPDEICRILDRTAIKMWQATKSCNSVSFDANRSHRSSCTAGIRPRVSRLSIRTPCKHTTGTLGREHSADIYVIAAGGLRPPHPSASGQPSGWPTNIVMYCKRCKRLA